jgi:hypothetical protein
MITLTASSRLRLACIARPPAAGKITLALLGMLALCAGAPSRAVSREAPGCAPKRPAGEHAQQMKVKPKVYYRPFCRRSHYVTDRAAPCWG